MRFLNGLLIIAVVAFMTACGGGAKTNNTEGTDSTSTTETANTDNTEKKNDETSSTETAKMPKDMLAQKWGYDGDAILAKMVEQATEEEKKAMTDEMKSKMKESFSKGSMEFKADGTYINTDDKGKEEKGTWTLSEDGKTLTTKKEGSDKEQVIAVKELTADKMVGEMKNGERTMTVVMKPFTGETTSTETKEGEKKEGENKEGEKKEGEKTEEKK